MGGQGGCRQPGLGYGGAGGGGASRQTRDQGSFDGLTATLERRFGQRLSTEESREQLTHCYWQERERLDALAADVRLQTQRGYPWFNPTDQKDLALHA